MWPAAHGEGGGAQWVVGAGEGSVDIKNDHHVT